MSNQPALAAAPRDNLFGICHALGETFGFNPLYLRIVLLVAVIVNPEVALIAYFSAGIAVMVAKLATRSSSKRVAKAKTLIHA
jgi:phage shock protein PspC (stress-responsive transcriptional regulator)